MKNVSVVLCTYNGEKYIREQLESILNQTYPVYEVVIQDDKSTDDTVDIIKEYESKYSFVKLFINDNNKGFCQNFLSAYLLASGDYILSCDQDDIWDNNKVNILVNSIENNMLIFSNSVLFDANKNFQYKSIPFYSQYISVLKPFVLGHQIMFDCRLLADIQYFIDHSYPYDYYIFLKAMSIGTVKYIDKPLVKWRRHNLAITYVEKNKNEKGLVGYYKSLLSLRDKNKRERSASYFYGIRKYVHYNDESLNRVIALMAKGDLLSIMRASFICLMNYRKLYPGKLRLVILLRSFFVPIFFIDKYGKGIVKI